MRVSVLGCETELGLSLAKNYGVFLLRIFRTFRRCVEAQILVVVLQS